MISSGARLAAGPRAGPLIANGASLTASGDELGRRCGRRPAGARPSGAPGCPAGPRLVKPRDKTDRGRSSRLLGARPTRAEPNYERQRSDVILCACGPVPHKGKFRLAVAKVLGSCLWGGCRNDNGGGGQLVQRGMCLSPSPGEKQIQCFGSSALPPGNAFPAPTREADSTTAP